MNIDELIELSRAPRLIIPRRNQANITIHEGQDLKAAINAVKEGDIIKLVGSHFGGFQIKHRWGFASEPRWTPPDRDAATVTIINGNTNGTQPSIEGFGWLNANPGTELHIVDCKLKPAEWKEDDTWVSNASIFGTFQGQRNAIRLIDCTLDDAEHSTTYGGSGLKWGGRTYTTGLHLRNCHCKQDAIAQEHWLYADNAPFFVVDGCTFSGTGRTHFQCGTRNVFAMPDKFLGVLVQNSIFNNAFCGSATGGSNTIYGYPGSVIFRKNTIHNPGFEGLDPSAGIVVFRTWNYGGNRLDENGWPTSLVIIDDCKINIGAGNLDAVLLESVYEAHIRGLDTSGSQPGNHWLNSPGQYSPVGIEKLKLYGPPFPALRSHIGDYTSKAWHYWSEAEMGMKV